MPGFPPAARINQCGGINLELNCGIPLPPKPPFHYISPPPPSFPQTAEIKIDTKINLFLIVIVMTVIPKSMPFRNSTQFGELGFSILGRL